MSQREISRKDRMKKYMYFSNDQLICISLLSNCKRCVLDEYLKLLVHKNLQIKSIKIIGKSFWVRNKTNKRLMKMRDVFWGNPNCKSFGLTCHHENRFIGQSQCTFNPFPKYAGESDRLYKSRLTKKYKISKKHRNRVEKEIAENALKKHNYEL